MILELIIITTCIITLIFGIIYCYGWYKATKDKGWLPIMIAGLVSLFVIGFAIINPLGYV